LFNRNEISSQTHDAFLEYGEEDGMKVKICLAIVGVVMGISGCGIGGACVGTTGEFPDICHNDYYADECDENNEIELNGATWVHHPGATCEGLGYTEECTNTSNTFREPGAC
jgi:hypothetical protein